MTYAKSTFSGGQGELEASPWAHKTGLVDLGEYLSAPTQRMEPPRPSRPYRNSAAALQMQAMGGGLGSTKKRPDYSADISRAQADAITRSAPTRQLTGFNMHGPTMDVDAMSGAQRQMFLPDSAASGPMGPSRASISPGAESMPEQPDSGQAMRAWLQMQAMLRGGR